MSACYVEFIHSGDARLSDLGECVASFERHKGMAEAEADRLWIRHFTDEQLATFWWPSRDEVSAVRSAWGDVPVFRTSDQKKARDWDIYSLFQVIRESDYRLLAVSSCAAGRFRIEFEPGGYPFGGTASLRRLAEAFGGTIVAVDDGTGREQL